MLLREMGYVKCVYLAYLDFARAAIRIAAKFRVANTVELTLQLYERCVAR